MKKTIPILAIATLFSVSCATDSAGNKTFAGLTLSQGIGLGARTAQDYLSTVKQPAPSGKNIEIVVQSEPVKPWWQYAFDLFVK